MRPPKSPSDFRDGLKMLGAGLAIAAFCLPAAIFYVYPRVKNAPKAPVEIAAADIGKITKPEDLPASWVAFTFDKAVPTEFAMVESVSDRVEHVYIMVPVGQRWLLVAVPENFQGNRLAGNLRTIPAFEFDDVYAATMETHQGQLLPFQFDAVGPQDGSLVVLLYMLLGGAAFGGLIAAVGVHTVHKGYFREPKPEPAEEPLVGAMPSFAGKDAPVGLYR